MESPTKQQARKYQARRAHARRSMLGFVRHTKPNYRTTWYHRVLLDFLDKIQRREITRGIVMMPPRHGKSEAVSRRFPAYCLGRNPDEQIIAASYAQDLANRMSTDVQSIMQTKRYRGTFENTRLMRDVPPSERRKRDIQQAKRFTVVGREGHLIAAGVGGPITGEGMTLGLIDDPFKNRQEADSQAHRDSVWNWYTSTFYTRLEPDSAILITHTRWRVDDLVGRLLKEAKETPGADHWHVLWLPCLAETELPRELADNPGVTIHGREADLENRKKGDPLWPWKMDRKRAKATKVNVGSRDWAALYQNRPQVEGGNIWKIGWMAPATATKTHITFEDSYEIRLDETHRFDVVDLATSEKQDSDYTVVGAFAGDRGSDRLVLMDLFRAHVTGGLHRRTINLNRQKSRSRYSVIEANAFQLELVQAMKRKGDPVREIVSDRDKVSRAYAAAPYAEQGRFYIRKGLPHLDEFIDEVLAFPNGLNDDMVDVMVHGILWWTTMPRSTGPLAVQRGDEELRSREEFNSVRPRRPRE